MKRESMHSTLSREICTGMQTVQLVKELLAELPAGVGATFTVVCADLDTAGLASERLRNPVSVIDPAESGVAKGPLLIVNPRSDQVAPVCDRAADCPTQHCMACHASLLTHI